MYISSWLVVVHSKWTLSFLMFFRLVLQLCCCVSRAVNLHLSGSIPVYCHWCLMQRTMQTCVQCPVVEADEQPKLFFILSQLLLSQWQPTVYKCVRALCQSKIFNLIVAPSSSGTAAGKQAHDRPLNSLTSLCSSKKAVTFKNANNYAIREFIVSSAIIADTHMPLPQPFTYNSLDNISTRYCFGSLFSQYYCMIIL